MTRRRRKTRWSGLRIATLVVIVVGGLALLLPRSWTQRLAGLGQALLPFQDAVMLSADSVIGGPNSDGDACATFAAQKQAAENRAAALAARVQALEDEVRLLSATRLWDAGGSRLGARGRLIPARVITDDLLSWRASRLIDAGAAQGISRGNPVTTREFTVAFDQEGGIRDGQAIVAGEVLMGFIDRASSQTASVRLLSDPQSGMKVRIGRIRELTFEGPDRYFWLSGQGPGRMQIADAELRDVQAGLIQKDDLVVSDPRDETLPAALVIGRVAGIAENPENPLFAILTVIGAAEERSLRRVYVYDPGREPEVESPTP